jgi:glycosyltransferase involved in cell wall biosynthesis
VVVDGETGRLVEPNSETELADAMRVLLADPAERARLGANGRARALDVFSRDRQLEQLHAIVAAGFNSRGS